MPTGALYFALRKSVYVTPKQENVMLLRIAIALAASAIVVAASIPTDAMGAGMAGVGGGGAFTEAAGWAASTEAEG